MQRTNFGVINLNLTKGNIKQDLLNFIKDCNIDYLLYYSIKSNMAIRLLNIHRGSLEENFNYSEYINLEINKECTINDVIQNNDLIVKMKEDGVKPLVEGVIYEIYIPVNINNNIIGCVYIANLKEKIGDINLNKLTEIIQNNIYDIYKLEMNKISYKAAIENTIFFHEVFKYKSPFMVNHIYNVASWAVQIAKKMNYSDEDLTKIYLAALLHDIGKMFVDENILNKKGKLSNEEYDEIKKHVNIGYNIIKDMFFV
ncbi:HD-GYP domain-containing protein [Thermobrachium celere]|uniref:HD-GYP domain-containing protein n=1 Tax=Thermobrachium celere TaxID=53422 RepID=UPI0019436AE0|nr:HD domain-containing protein [Thermobrachium celere]GFR36421.1 hypothetical protein TCEA9_22330 [Thermobrachium celere]